MFKLVVLSVLVAACVAKPSGLIAPIAYHASPSVAVVHAAPTLYHAPGLIHAPAVIASVPTSYSSQSSTVVHGSKAAIVAAPWGAPVISAYHGHGLVAAPIAVNAW